MSTLGVDPIKEDVDSEEGLETINEAWEKMSPEAKELVLHADNTGSLYRQSKVPVMSNLNKKFAKGVYNHEKAAKLWGYHADRAAHSYAKEHGTPDTPWHKMFPTSVRREAAKHWADTHHDNMKHGVDNED
jgi:hypothetical protein